MYTDYRLNDENVKTYENYERIIKTINKRFLTYGYKRIKTSTFEQYDLYSKVTSSMNQNEMIKLINRAGEVLVLRPDVTIPITRKIAEDFSELQTDLRYFYVQDVFRQSNDYTKDIESTQAGVEYFCESSPEADAEVIALACHTLKDLGFNEIKIELGHADFFKELVLQIDITEIQLNQLKNMIQAKSIVDIEFFLRGIPIEESIKEALEMIPFLYGNPHEVNERAKKITLTEKMSEKLNYLMNVYEILKLYGLEDNIVMDLGLINHMGYYSDVIFQGFVEKYGQPVLMGGRYDQLGNEFGANLPAIGFACEIDSLVEASKDQDVGLEIPIDLTVFYDSANMAQGLAITNDLREQNFNVLSFPIDLERANRQPSIATVQIEQEQTLFQYGETTTPFFGSDELVKLLMQAKENL